ncbi:MAG: RES family NAD+ phosphorylase [Rhodospirillales bacterium]
MVTPSARRVRWPRYHRLIEARRPQSGSAGVLSDPQEWRAVTAARAKTDPRLKRVLENFDLIPPERRVSGPGAEHAMAPFVFASPDHRGRFHDGTFGVFYAAREFETAAAEVVFHRQRTLAATQQRPGWLNGWILLTGAVDAAFLDLCGGGFEDLLNPGNYAASQAFAREARNADAGGAVYPAVRDAQRRECFAAFFPDVMGASAETAHFRYYWSGERIERLHRSADGETIELTL